jgi:RimJ/RimL family protein N-acetyltransferase
MIHAFGFKTLELQRIYASVVPQNTASRRVFEKLGYREDTSPDAREYAEEPGDIVLSLPRDRFVIPADITIGVR